MYESYDNVSSTHCYQLQYTTKKLNLNNRRSPLVQAGGDRKVAVQRSISRQSGIKVRIAKGAWDILQQEYGRKFTYSPTTMDPSQHSDNPMDPSLYKAVKDGKVEDLDQYTDLFDAQLTSNHNTILHIAAHFGKLECVAKILEKKSCLLRRVNANCENPLHIAVRERHHGIVQALIKCARELDHLDPESASGTRLEILRAINVDGDTALHLAVREGGAEIVSLLVAEDPDFQHPPNKAEETPLYLAAERENGDSMVESILASSKLPAYTSPSGRTALHAAIIFQQRVGVKKLLVRYEELIDKADTEGWTPLHYAVYCYNKEAVIELLQRKKSVGYTRTSEKYGKSTVLHIAASVDNKHAMEEILTHSPDCWEMVNSKGRNILHIAVDEESEEVISYIIKKEWLESLINQKDFEGNTPLHLLASSEMKFVYTETKLDDLIKHPRANMYAFNNQNKSPGDIVLSGDVSDKDFLAWASNMVVGNRNIAKRLDQENRKESEKRRKERKERSRADKAEALKKTSESLTLVATLIATITFAAAFAIPGGYDGNQGPKQGMAVLVRQASFKAFAIANTIAVMCSTSSVVYYVFAAFHYFDEEKQGRRYENGFYLVLIAIVAMTVGFISGTYAMLVRSLGLAIATSIIASITFLIYFLELRRLFELWYYLMFPWQEEGNVFKHSWPAKMLAIILGI
ncbi:hypothetical protein Vadar_007879 [Vaccinium darrowii]|uniref:Uncharacterized protein n=1 Tax=Vaccinium darrowii TaxID=229202 RepID=A0ACB7XP16_9ERIC|nr:hypothetical protein Vadar_007879 [Vaccinium darrowii]